MGRNLQLFKKARERIEAKFATEGGAPCDRRGASVASVAMSHRGGSFLEASDNSLENKLSNDINDIYFLSNPMDEPRPQKTENTARPSDKSDKSDKSAFTGTSPPSPPRLRMGYSTSGGHVPSPTLRTSWAPGAIRPRP